MALSKLGSMVRLIHIYVSIVRAGAALAIVVAACRLAFGDLAKPAALYAPHRTAFLVTLYAAMAVCALLLLVELFALNSAITASPPALFLSMLAACAAAVLVAALTIAFITATVRANKTREWSRPELVSPKLEQYWAKWTKHVYDINRAQRKLMCCGWPRHQQQHHAAHNGTGGTSLTDDMRHANLMLAATRSTMQSCCLSAVASVGAGQCDFIMRVWPNVTAAHKLHIYRTDCKTAAIDFAYSWCYALSVASGSLCAACVAGVLLAVLLAHTLRFAPVPDGDSAGDEAQRHCPGVYDVAAAKPRALRSAQAAQQDGHDGAAHVSRLGRRATVIQMKDERRYRRLCAILAAWLTSKRRFGV